MKISIDNALKGGFKRMTQVLFQPFDLKKWLIIGFASFLATLGRGGGGLRLNFPSEISGEGNPVDFSALEEWILVHLTAIVLLGIGLLTLGFAIFLVLNWLSSRGQFLFLHVISENKAEIKVPWVKYGAIGDRLFIFRLILGVIVFMVVLVILILGIMMIYPQIKGESFGLAAFLKIAFVVLFLVFLVLVVAIINMILMDFVVPLMFKKDLKVLDAFSVFYNQLFKGNFFSFFLFYLVKIGLSIAAGFVVLIATCLTCCIAALPYISSVVFLPITVFFESFTLSFLAEFGNEYNLFTWKLEDRNSVVLEKTGEKNQIETPSSEDSQ